VGVAYIPDGGNGTSPGISVVHIIDTSDTLLAMPGPTAAPPLVAFPNDVGPLGFASDGTVAVSADGTAGAFTLLQPILGLSGSLLTPTGTTYNTTVVPTAAPSPSPSATPTPMPSATPTLTNVTSLAILETSGLPTTAVALAVGGGDGILGVNGLVYPPLNYGQYVVYNDPSNTVTPPPSAGPRYNIVLGPGNADALVRGPSDLIAYTITPSDTGYTLNATADNTTLGTGANILQGPGDMVIDPASDQFALVAQAPALNDVTLLYGLPSAIHTTTTQLILPTTPRAIAWNVAGTYAVVGADGGYYVLTLDTSSSTAPTVKIGSISPADPSGLVTPPPFIGCDGATHHLTSVTSVAITQYGNYLVLYGPTDQTSCTVPGATGSLEAFPFPVPSATPTATPTPAPSTTPVPTFFVQNNLPAPGTGQDLMVVH